MFRPTMIALQKALNSSALLCRIERGHLAKAPPSMPPPLFILGCPRSGTTLIYETLCTQYNVAYLSNLAMMFFTAPGWATQHSFSRLGRPAARFRSDIGFIPGLMAPSEAGQFWRTRLAGEGTLRSAEHPQNNALRPLFASLSASMGGPVVVKNLYLQSRLDALTTLFPELCVLRVTRDPTFTAQSILKARKQVAGDMSHWWGPHPRCNPISKTLPAETQVALQVHGLTEDLTEDLAQHVTPDHVMTLNYEAFCKAPTQQLAGVGAWYSAQTGHPLTPLPDRAANVPDHFDAANRISLPARQWADLKRAVQEASVDAL